MSQYIGRKIQLPAGHIGWCARCHLPIPMNSGWIHVDMGYNGNQPIHNPTRGCPSKDNAKSPDS